MNLWAFSVSLSVKDLEASKSFYEKLWFEATGWAVDQNWVILRNSDHVIGLFQWMFEGNLLTFNPGWNQQAQAIDDYTDIRDLQKKLKNDGVTLMTEADANTTGPASCMIQDPDGNMILIDQHI